MLNRIISAESASAIADQPRASNSQLPLALLSDSDLSSIGKQVQLVRKVQKARSRRVDFLSASLLGEPAWDMLLELFASAVEQRRVTIGELCIASYVPQTTALRWIDTLQREGLVTRRSDPLDGRRVHIQLTPSGYATMKNYAERLTNVMLAA